MSGFPMTGLDPNDPIPRFAIEIQFAQGRGSGAVGNRKVCLLAQKTSAGSETENDIGTFISDETDAVARFGDRCAAVVVHRQDGFGRLGG